MHAATGAFDDGDEASTQNHDEASRQKRICENAPTVMASAAAATTVQWLLLLCIGFSCSRCFAMTAAAALLMLMNDDFGC